MTGPRQRAETWKEATEVYEQKNCEVAEEERYQEGQ